MKSYVKVGCVAHLGSRVFGSSTRSLEHHFFSGIVLFPSVCLFSSYREIVQELYTYTIKMLEEPVNDDTDSMKEVPLKVSFYT